jgi:putative sterol carrier protein
VADQAPDPMAINPEQFAGMVGGASDEDLATGFAANRELILGEIFRRMEEHFDPTNAKDISAVVEWRILDGPDGGDDRWQLVIRDGACNVTRDGDETPTVTFRVGPVDFIKLVTGNVQGPELFMRGALQIEGDLMQAAVLQGYFRVPGGPAPGAPPAGGPPPAG